MDGYKLCRRRRGGGVPLHIREALNTVELESTGSNVKYLWVRFMGKANKAVMLVGVCYRAPNPDEELGVLLYKQLDDV